MIMVSHDKRDKSMTFLIPMKYECNSILFEDISTSATWVYYCDGKPHRNSRIKRDIPTMVVPGLEDIWGGLDDIRRAGYRKHWIVFQDTETGLYYFGNYPSHIRSRDPFDVEKALQMMPIDINILHEL